MRRPVGLMNARVITIDKHDRICQAVGIDGARIAAVGSDAEVAARLGSSAILFDCSGRTIMPGMIDAHAHLDREGLKDSLPSFAGANSVEDVLDRIADLVRQKEPGEWIVTMPVGEPPFYDPRSRLAEGRWLDRADLDRVAPHNPVYIRPAWGWWHGVPPLVSVANSVALRAIGLPRDGGAENAIRLERDGKGELTGRIFEDMFMPLMELTYLLEPCRFTGEQRAHAIRHSLKKYNAAGTTGIFEGHGVAREVMDIYRGLDKKNELTVRAHLVRSVPWFEVKMPRLATFLQSLGAPMREAISAFLVIDDLEVELGHDPLDEIRAKAHPYTGWAGFYYNSGLPRDDLEQLLLELLGKTLRPVSLGVNIIDLYWRVAGARPPVGRRWVVGHVGALTGDDIRRIRDLGACVTTHTNRFIYRQGCGFSGGPCPTGRSKNPSPRPARELVPLRSLLDAGVVVGLGSDNAPVSLFYPIWEAVARRCATCGRRIGPEESITRMEALRAATLGGAYLCFDEENRGSIEVDKLADLIILDADPLMVSEDSLRDIAADMTMIGGRVVHDRHNEFKLEMEPAGTKGPSQVGESAIQ